MSDGTRLELVSLESLVSDAQRLSAWRRLAAEVPGASYFQTPDWVVSWWDTIGRHARGEAALIWEGDHLTGIFALAETRERLTGRLPFHVPIVTNAGSGIGTDHAAWLALPDAEIPLREWIVTRAPLLLKGIPLDSGEALGGRLIETNRCPRLPIAEAPDRISSKLAKTLRNAQRRLAREGVVFSWREPGAVDSEDLTRLYDLHRARRADTGDDSVFDDPERRAFHERLLEWGDSRGGTTLVEARRDELVVGMLYGFTWGDTYAYYQTGWDPAFKQLSLGSVLVLEAIEESAKRGLSTFDFLRGPDDYKYRFGAADVVEGTFAVGSSAGLSAIAAFRRARGSLKDAER
jgi:CelD/BcsL family acetyltransferase involved in cellulose biosynthesis